MFYCVGENYENDKASGKGETMEDAIRAWASTSGDGVFDEFERFNPDVLMGPRIEVAVVKEFAIVTNN
jgi:hypothetical protein